MTDTDIIKKIIAPNALVIQKNSTFDWSDNIPKEIICWGVPMPKYLSGQGIITKFRYVNNPDGTIRWFFPDDLKYPSFLTLYNASGFKSKLIKLAFQWAFRLGLKNVLTQGEFSHWAVWTEKGTDFQRLIKATNADGFSVFTGTVGKNRKAIIEINKDKKTTDFIKFPISENSINLIELEKNNLQQLEKYTFQKSTLPNLTPYLQNENVAILSNVKPQVPTVNSMDLQETHLQAIEEWIDKTQTKKTLKDISAYQTITGSLTALNTDYQPVNDLSIEKIKQLLDGLNQLHKGLDKTKVIPTAMAHCDFTPWNMYFGTNKIYVYDWELAKMDMPLLFDAIHFIFQSHILIKRTPFDGFKNELETLQKNTIAQGLTSRYQFNFKESYQLYLLYNISYYLNLYVRQEQLHIQAHWLIDTWLDAVLDINKD